MLTDQVKPRWVVFTANPENRFGHPGPGNLQKTIETVGIEGVRVTGAFDHIVITPMGVNEKSYIEHRHDLVRILNPLIRRSDDMTARARQGADADAVAQLGGQLGEVNGSSE